MLIVEFIFLLMKHLIYMRLFRRVVILIPSIRWLRRWFWISKHGFDSEFGQTNDLKVAIHSFVA